MAWWNWIGDILKGGKEVAEVFTENKENEGQRSHERSMADIGLDMASLQQFAAEFHQRSNRTWWDSLVDGLNRLPRPLLTIAIIAFFILAPLDPARFMQIAKAYEYMPPGYWALLSIIISFYFGGRMQLKAQDMAMKKDSVQAMKELIAMKQEFRKLDAEEESAESKMFDEAVRSGARVAKNRVVEQWLAGRTPTPVPAPTL